MTLLSLLLLAVHAPKLQAKSIGEVPFAIDVDTIVVPATVNGRDLRLIFDTGFAGAVVVDSTVDLGKPTSFTTLRDFVGEFEAPVTKINSLKLGSQLIKPSDLDAVSQPGAANFGNDTHVDGLMGLSVIKDYVTEINFEHQKFIFLPDSEDITKRKPDNKRTFLVPMLPMGSRAIVLPVLTSDGKTMNLALDTGNAFYATTHKDVLERVGLWPAGQDAKFLSESGVASGTVSSWAKTLKGLTIFGVPVSESVWDVIDLPSSESTSDGTVGFGFLKNFNITFDYRRRFVWLENFSGVVENKPDGSLGISAAWSKASQAVKIFKVSEGSPADLAKIVDGDLLLEVDGEELTNISYKRLHRLLMGEVNSKVKLAISHGGIARRVEVERKALVNP